MGGVPTPKTTPRHGRRRRHHSILARNRLQVAAMLVMLFISSVNGLLVNTKKLSVATTGRGDDMVLNRPKNSSIGSTVPASTATTSSVMGENEVAAFYPPSSVRTLPDLSRHSNLIESTIVVPIVANFVPWQDVMYDKALHLKCPFLRRRAIDAVEFWHGLMRTLLDPKEMYLGVCPSLLCHGRSCTKRFGLSLEDLLTAIRADWKEGSNLGYYVTGKLSTDIYRDDCLFDGPDPDMPVVGLRKYIFAASQLFDQKQSWSKLSSIEIDRDGSCVVAHWQFRGILRLPWKPVLPVVSGSTTYYVDACGLINKHVETWDLSVQEAFLKTFLPALFPHDE